ncbi:MULTISPECIES: hypothetical protein [Bacillus]|uniref:hypothetical protein n=1 Tax=Bacillus TaxID=1386 RepID=UPI0008FDCEB5|nr:hypothetical protein [Bacillus sp. L27]OJD46820.1 hypothetical protein BAU24_17460 [Bacillus sp. L27]
MTTHKEHTLPIVNQGAVTFLDVLGWKGIWEKHNDAIDRLYGLVNYIRDLADEITAQVSNSHAEARGIETTVLSISDTIAIFTPGPPLHSLQIHAAICSDAIPKSIERMIPIRGATSYGEFAIKENIMVGPAVDEAASWHESTDWIGVVLTPSPVFHLNGSIPIVDSLPSFWDKYTHIPFKKNVKHLTHCVKWSYNPDELFNIFSKMGPQVPEIAPKYLNTLEYLKSIS